MTHNVVYLFSIYHGEFITQNLGNYQADMTISPSSLNQSKLLKYLQQIIKHLILRCNAKGLKLTRPSMKTGRYQMLKEHHHIDDRKDKKRSVPPSVLLSIIAGTHDIRIRDQLIRGGGVHHAKCPMVSHNLQRNSHVNEVIKMVYGHAFVSHRIEANLSCSKISHSILYNIRSNYS